MAGIPDALPADQDRPGGSTSTRRYRGPTAAAGWNCLRPGRIEVMEPHIRAYALVNGRRIAVTRAVQIELFGG